VEKHKLIEAKDDLRLGSYDAVRGAWITEEVLGRIRAEDSSGGGR
jgi:hypothetical protein